MDENRLDLPEGIVGISKEFVSMTIKKHDELIDTIKNQKELIEQIFKIVNDNSELIVSDKIIKLIRTKIKNKV